MVPYLLDYYKSQFLRGARLGIIWFPYDIAQPA